MAATCSNIDDVAAAVITVLCTVLLVWVPKKQPLNRAYPLQRHVHSLALFLLGLHTLNHVLLRYVPDPIDSPILHPVASWVLPPLAALILTVLLSWAVHIVEAVAAGFIVLMLSHFAPIFVSVPLALLAFALVYWAIRKAGARAVDTESWEMGPSHNILVAISFSISVSISLVSWAYLLSPRDLPPACENRFNKYVLCSWECSSVTTSRDSVLLVAWLCTAILITLIRLVLLAISGHRRGSDQRRLVDHPTRASKHLDLVDDTPVNERRNRSSSMGGADDESRATTSVQMPILPPPTRWAERDDDDYDDDDMNHHPTADPLIVLV